jgi:hypothetical protein
MANIASMMHEIGLAGVFTLFGCSLVVTDGNSAPRMSTWRTTGLRTDYRRAAQSMKSSTDGHGSRHGKTSSRKDVHLPTNEAIESRSQGESSGLWLTLCILVATCA